MKSKINFVSMNIVIASLIMLMTYSCNVTSSENSEDSLSVNNVKEKTDSIKIFTSCSDYPFYVRYLLTADNYVAFRLPVSQKGDYQIVLGSNTLEGDKFADLVEVYITGKFHKQIPYTKTRTKGRTNMYINFKVEESTAYSSPGKNVFFELRVDKKKFTNLSDDERKILNTTIGEIGFGPNIN